MIAFGNAEMQRPDDVCPYACRLIRSEARDQLLCRRRTSAYWLGAHLRGDYPVAEAGRAVSLKSNSSRRVLRAGPFSSAVFIFGSRGTGNLLALAFCASLLKLGLRIGPCKSGGPASRGSSFKVDRDRTHNRAPGSRSCPCVADPTLSPRQRSVLELALDRPDAAVPNRPA